MMAGQQRQHERPRFMGSGIGYQSPCKRYDRPEIACWGFGCSIFKKGCERMNKARLEYEMSVRGVTRAKLCEVLGISRSAFYRKCNGGSEFTQGEIQKIVDFLNLETPVGIFFDAKVS
jgi:hypothetical protein|nr:MAG: helix-turn-helix domain protein [Bacteriophage sp.]